MNKYICNSTFEEILMESLDPRDVEIDLIGILEQIIFSFTFRDRTIFKNISQSFSISQNDHDILNGDSYLTDTIGAGIFTVKDFHAALDSFVDNSLTSFKDVNIFLTGGYDSRFLLNSINPKSNVNCFTYYYGNSFEKSIASKIASIKQKRFFPVEINSSWYTSFSNFKKHRGLVPSHSWVLPNFTQEIVGLNHEFDLPFIHGFMGDPIFGDKAIFKDRNKSDDQIVEEYFNKKSSRYRPFFNFDIKPFENEILDDIYFEFKKMKVNQSNADIEEVFFIKKRQQMISKIIDSVPAHIKIITPFYNDKNLIKVALGIPQCSRVGKKAFLDYAKKKFPDSIWQINADNPYGLSKPLKNSFRRICNSTQYVAELFNIYSSISPFQHEHLKVQINKNKETFQFNISEFIKKTGLIINWESSMQRKYNSLDLPFTLASIAFALK